MLADAYPIPARARVFAAHGIAGRVGGLVAPLAIGGLVTALGGGAAWRWGFVAIGIPTIVIGVVAFFMPDPPRGQFEQKETIGEVISTEGAPPISLGASYQRIMQIHTYKSSIFAFTALGFGWVSVPVFVSLYLDEHFHLGAFHRALVATVPGVLALAVIPLVAKRFDTHVPARARRRRLVLTGALFIPSGILVGGLHGDAQRLVVRGVRPRRCHPRRATHLDRADLRRGEPVLPAGPGHGDRHGHDPGHRRLRRRDPRWPAVGRLGLRFAIVALGVPTSIIGGLLLMNGARFIRNDLSLVVEELREEEDEHERQQANPDDIPVLQVRNIDFSYGPVQVLFDVDFEVRRGEALALLGTNGAGKSTILRVIAGLGMPVAGRRAAQRPHRSPTSARARGCEWGILLLPGGKGVFPAVTVGRTWRWPASCYRDDRADRRAPDRRRARAVPRAGATAGRAGRLAVGRPAADARAGHGADARARVLLIDELSLGPGADRRARSCSSVVERLKARGQTMIIVEQSLNVALAIADRAVFLEKGQVRFEGAARGAARARRPRPRRVPRERGRLTPWSLRDHVHAPARVRRVRQRPVDRPARAWASCSSTGRPGSSTSPSATWACVGAGLLVAAGRAVRACPFWLALLVRRRGRRCSAARRSS